MIEDKSGSGDQAPNRINVAQASELDVWAKKLNASPEQIKDAVQAVGDLASDVEEHLKGSRSSTNAERTRQAGIVENSTSAND